MPASVARWRVPIVILLAGAVIAYGLPIVLVNHAYMLRLATSCALLVTLATAWNQVGGLTGYPSFATAAFFGFGAYASAVMQKYGWSLLAGHAAAGVLAALLAAPFGFVILRLKGHYFAVASLMLAFILREVTTGWADLTGGGMGLNLPGAGGNPLEVARVALEVMVMLAAASLAISALIAQSWLGFGLSCIRMNETAALSAGINGPRLKTMTFAISSALCGIAGAAYANWIGYIDPSDVYDVMWSVRPIIATLIGGVGTLFGPLVGALIYLAFEELMWRNLLTFGTGALGILVTVLILVLPGGVLLSLKLGRKP